MLASSARVLVAVLAVAAVPALAEAGSRRRTRRGVAPVTTATAPKSDEAVQAAIASTPTGGVAWLPYGVYRTAIVIDRPMTVVSDRRGTTLDAAGLGRPAIEVRVAGVTIDGVRVTASSVDGIVAGEAADRVRLVRCVVEACAGDGIRIGAAASVTVDSCVLDRNGGDGVDISARGGVVERSTFRENVGAGVRVGGEDVRVSDCTFLGGAEGIAFVGVRGTAYRVSFRSTRVAAHFLPTSEDCSLERCDARYLATLAIVDDGAYHARIQSCRASGTSSDAITLRGTWHVVEGNSLGRVHGTAVVGDGLSLRVADNSVVSADAAGVRLVGMGNTVEGNVLGPCGGDAVAVEGTANVVSNNECRDGSGAGLAVEGPMNLVVGNRVIGSAGEGIRLAGDGCTLQDNRLERTGLEGIVVTGRDNVVRTNSIARCGGLGVSDAGVGTTFDRNRID
jgi:hypothetical protein